VGPGPVRAGRFGYGPVMGTWRVQLLGDACVRVEWVPGGRVGLVDAPSLFAAHRPAPEREAVWTDAGGPGGFETARFRVEWSGGGDRPSAENLRVVVRHPGGDRVWRPGEPSTGNLGGTLHTLDGVRGPVPLPDGLLSRDGWSVVDDSTGPVLEDGWVRGRGASAGSVDWYVFAYGQDYRAALGALARVSGPVPLPRRCALGSWYSRYWPYTSGEFRGIVDEFTLHGFPLDVLVLDMDWHTGGGRDGWTGWSWNRRLIPDAEELLAWLHHRGLAVTLNLHPAEGVGPGEDRYAAFMRRLGREPRGEMVPFDAADRAYMTALFDEVHAPLEDRRIRVQGREVGDTGVDFWWVDWQQEPFTRSIPELSNLRWLNHLYFHHTSRGGRRGMSFSRWAGAGDHRHPVHFSGDSHTGWAMLRFAVPFTSTAGNIGCFFWSHDIGGHFGPRLEETSARWVQFGALSAALRLHSARSPVLDRRPWSCEERFCGSMRRAFALRAALLPYVYSEAERSSRETVPLLRPMYLDRAGDPRAYAAPGQYFLGEDLLCAPIVSPGMGERCVAAQAVWVPDGESDWYDWFTGERVRAGEESVRAGDIDETVLLARGGAPIPTRPATFRPASEAIVEVVVRLFPGRAGSVCQRSLFEDDGESALPGPHARTSLEASWSRAAGGAHADDVASVRETVELVIGPTRGDYAGMPDERVWTLELAGVGSVRGVKVDGVEAEVVGEAGAPGRPALARIRTPARPLSRGCVIEAEFERVDGGDLAGVHRRRRLEQAVGRPLAAMDLRAAVLSEVERTTDVSKRSSLLAIGAGVAAVAEDHEVRVVDSMSWLDGPSVTAEVVDRFGNWERTVSSVELELRAAGAARVAGVALPAGRIEEPPVGLRATRLVRCRGRIGRTPVVFEGVVERRLRPVEAFRVAGPFAWDWRRSITEQRAAPEFGRAGPAEWYHGVDDRWFTWHRARRGEKWAVDLRESLPGPRGLAYAATTLVTSKSLDASIEFDSGDKLEAWVNGVKVYSQDGFDTHAAQVGSARVRLERGWNTLLVKTSDGGGGWGFSLGIDADDVVTPELEDDRSAVWTG
jgi:alpha-glucosidase (family GH31 glycosyl hydrolase)